MRASAELHEPWISPPTNSSMFKYYLQRIERDDHEGFAICTSEEERIVGAININNIVRGSFQSASLGYYVGAEHQGTGFMQEGLNQLITYAFNTMGLHRLEANIQPENVRSQNLVERCGFTLEGYSEAFLFINGAWRDHQRWCRIHQRASLRAQGGEMPLKLRRHQVST
jgi:ribosomal-protein-alanine N-acetyltransferase